MALGLLVTRQTQTSGCGSYRGELERIGTSILRARRRMTRTVRISEAFMDRRVTRATVMRLAYLNVEVRR